RRRARADEDRASRGARRRLRPDSDGAVSGAPRRRVGTATLTSVCHGRMVPVRTTKPSLCLVLGLAVAACSPAVEPDAPDTASAPAGDWVLTEGIATPESAYFDPVSGLVFSSQIDGEPGGRDGNGRIVSLRPDGTL